MCQAAVLLPFLKAAPAVTPRCPAAIHSHIEEGWLLRSSAAVELSQCLLDLQP